MNRKSFLPSLHIRLVPWIIPLLGAKPHIYRILIESIFKRNKSIRSEDGSVQIYSMYVQYYAGKLFFHSFLRFGTFPFHSTPGFPLFERHFSRPTCNNV